MILLVWMADRGCWWSCLGVGVGDGDEVAGLLDVSRSVILPRRYYLWFPLRRFCLLSFPVLLLPKLNLIFLIVKLLVTIFLHIVTFGI